MVEVYRTNVENQKEADFLQRQLTLAFPHYLINFDLEDCDKILRVECRVGCIAVLRVIELLKDYGCIARVLEDTPPVKDTKDSVSSGNGTTQASLR